MASRHVYEVVKYDLKCGRERAVIVYSERSTYPHRLVPATRGSNPIIVANTLLITICATVPAAVSSSAGELQVEQAVTHISKWNGLI